MARNKQQCAICGNRQRKIIHTLSRRTVIAGLPLLVAGCDNSGRLFDTFSGGEYGTTQDGSYTVPAVHLSTIDGNLMRQEVS